MRIAIASDEPYEVHRTLVSEVEKRGHTVVPFGSVRDQREHSYATVAEEAGLAVAKGDVDEGIFLCWTGTGISIAANKIAGVRAALCADASTATSARIWNHANVLCLSNRSLAPDVAREILSSWFDTERGPKGAALVADLEAVDQRHRR